MQVRAALLAVTCGLVLRLSPGAAAGPPAVTVSRVPYGDGLTMERHRPAALADDAPVVVLVHDLLVGLGGYYGWDGSDVPPEVVTDGTVAWFGAPPEDDPDAWHEGNPRWWVRRTRDIPPVRLIARPTMPTRSGSSPPCSLEALTSR